jgi:creatinine amidohydrolase/Fe(II)-dependent formamide hydrolase-like protein
MEWQKSTISDLNNLIERGCNLAVFTIGSVEQHANHLATRIDTIIAYESAVRAARIERVIVAPPVYYTMEVFGKRIKGTIGIGPVTVLDYLEGICDYSFNCYLTLKF